MEAVKYASSLLFFSGHSQLETELLSVPLETFWVSVRQNFRLLWACRVRAYSLFIIEKRETRTRNRNVSANVSTFTTVIWRDLNLFTFSGNIYFKWWGSTTVNTFRSVWFPESGLCFSKFCWQKEKGAFSMFFRLRPYLLLISWVY